MVSLFHSFVTRQGTYSSVAATSIARNSLQQLRCMAGGKRPKHSENFYLKRKPTSIKWRHVWRYCDEWFSADHLRSDTKLKAHIQSNRGWCQFQFLLKRRMFRDWTDETLLKNAFEENQRYQIKEQKGLKFVQRYDIQEQLAESRLPGPKPPKLDLYDISSREIVVHENASGLKETCQRLSQADCLGFDVEFAVLPGDDRPPAMIKLASNELVALIWLDKFPDHGRSVRKDPECSPLLKLLANDKISKVGVRLLSYARQLALFWGMTSRTDFIRDRRKIIDSNFKQLIDLRDHAEGKNLYPLCSSILNLKMPSRRHLHGHFRNPRLSRRMKLYAARDAACPLDIWQALQDQSKAKGQHERKRNQARKRRI